MERVQSRELWVQRLRQECEHPGPDTTEALHVALSGNERGGPSLVLLVDVALHRLPPVLSAVGRLLTSVLLSGLGRQTTAGRLKVVSCALELLPTYLPKVIYRQRQGWRGKGDRCQNPLPTCPLSCRGFTRCSGERLTPEQGALNRLHSVQTRFMGSLASLQTWAYL